MPDLISAVQADQEALVGRVERLEDTGEPDGTLQALLPQVAAHLAAMREVVLTSAIHLTPDGPEAAAEYTGLLNVVEEAMIRTRREVEADGESGAESMATLADALRTLARRWNDDGAGDLARHLGDADRAELGEAYVRTKAEAAQVATGP